MADLRREKVASFISPDFNVNLQFIAVIKLQRYAFNRNTCL